MMAFLSWFDFFRLEGNGLIKSAWKARRMTRGIKTRPHPKHWT